ncbi:glutamate receptor ionotropic, delta-2-like [Episyrphus balteatus]|uniref:glutamate receptor ionotropic, delta-2-like n=1 Tax=Episyrphus balteatus TaxID=286459 RepID=UPI00248638F1|nr:glutamate receptor ionotropic, delta-2-like [Episyrphus balteatus]
MVLASISNFESHENHNNAILTIEYITRTLVVEQKRTFTFSTQAENQKMLSMFGEIVDKVLKRIDYAAIQIDQKNYDMVGIRECNILFVDSFNAFKNTEPILINQFENGIPTNGTDNIFPPKLNTLQGCPLKAVLWDLPPFLRIFPDREGLDKFIDFEGVLLRTFAEKMDFSLDYIIPLNDEFRGKRFPNGTTNGAMKMLQDRTADLSLGSFRYTMERADIMTAALPYYQNWQIFGVLKYTRPYTAIEILIFPFTTSTWLSLITFVVVLMSLGLLAMSYCKIVERLFLEFSGIQLVESFFGVSISHLPHGNFLRYLLIMWAIFAFVIRSAYQSLLFKLLQSKLYQKPPETLQELVTQGYTLVLTQGTFETVVNMLKIENKKIRYLIRDNPSDLAIYEFIERTPGKYAGVSPIDFLTYYVQANSRRDIFHILREKVSAQHNTMYFSKHSYLIERFNKILMNLRGCGMIDLWASQSWDTSYFDQRNKGGYVKEPLKLSQLRGAFDIYLVLIFVAFVVFLLEMILNRIKCIKKT